MTQKKLSTEIRVLIASGGPPYDTGKVMAWFNRAAEAALIEIEVLEENSAKNNPEKTITPEVRAELDSGSDPFADLIRPHFQRHMAATGCILCTAGRLRYLLDEGLYGLSMNDERYCREHNP